LENREALAHDPSQVGGHLITYLRFNKEQVTECSSWKDEEL
jgi:hypothetical protein